MRFRGGGVGHQTTRAYTHTLERLNSGEALKVLSEELFKESVSFNVSETVEDSDAEDRLPEELDAYFAEVEEGLSDGYEDEDVDR